MNKFESMAGTGSSMLYSLLLFIIILSLQEMYRGKLASTELFTILGGFTSSLLFVMLLTFIGNYQETIGIKTGWGAAYCSLLDYSMRSTSFQGRRFPKANRKRGGTEEHFPLLDILLHFPRFELY
ncbi:uncharacterized protein LOC114288438 isoform X2 [Camellia sinensis]|uniref:uncharacterized protein LOC114288438 isoform X2 n=1 Tax=Camellia sinensis TaxID=4442 RepID=UPI00103657E3|nr:uncharacterized protein LOC114288438 isoform X2 [Camellia sinensis]